MAILTDGGVVGEALVGPDGTRLTRPFVALEPQEVEVLRAYKRLLQKYRYREALYCDKCWDGNLRHDGTRAEVTASGVSIACRCRVVGTRPM